MWTKKSRLDLFFSYFPPVHSSLYKHEIRGGKNPDRPTGLFFYSPGGQETIIHLRVAYGSQVGYKVSPKSYGKFVQCLKYRHDKSVEVNTSVKNVL